MPHLFTEDEARMFDNHMHYRDSRSQAEFQQGRVFAKAVLQLADRGTDLETARFAVGQATMRRPNVGLAETLETAVSILKAREAA
jgi:hypothetical protein